MDLDDIIIGILTFLFLILVLVGVCFFIFSAGVEVYEYFDERNHKTTNKINIYPAYDCEFITHKQEYWCIDEVIIENEKST